MVGATRLLPPSREHRASPRAVRVIGPQTLCSQGGGRRRRRHAWIGLGANLPEDAVYPLNIGDSDGKQLIGANKYVLHFAKNEIPPVGAFWSVTLYDKDGFPTVNALKRNAIGDRDELKYNADGSLDLYFQSESPGKDKESNWLPAPTGGFNLTMRLYAPKSEALTGKWNPPPVTKLPGPPEPSHLQVQ